MNKNYYSIAPDAYLERARDHLISGEAVSIFYAALELRCFVESRQDRYLEAQAEYAKSIPKRWKIGAQGKALEAIFEKDQIQQISWQSNNELVFEAHYVPLSPELRKIAERLGSLLHAQEKWISPEDKWWNTTREELRHAYNLAWTCNKGNLLSPMLLIKGRTLGNMMLEIESDTKDKLLANMKKGAMGVLNVDYLDEAPAHWTSDLPE